MKQIIFNIIFIATTLFLAQPASAQATKDTMLLKKPNYFINVFENDKSLFQQGARIKLQEWVNPKLRDSIWKHMRGATFDEAARYSKEADKKRDVRLKSGYYKLVGANEIYTFYMNKNGQIDGRFKMEVKSRDEDKSNRVTFLRVENGKPLQLTLKIDGRLRGKMDFYENTIMIKHFFKEVGRLSEVDSIQKTVNGERPKQLLHIEYTPDGKIKEKK